MGSKLNSKDHLTQLAVNSGITSWDELCEYIKVLPYGRNKSRNNFGLVITESKGTCSSKHALLKTIADLNNISNITLTLGMYKMNSANTPGIGTILNDRKIDFLPEAHCYLKTNEIRADYTSESATISLIEKRHYRRNRNHT